tara:strand:+ start:88 stop:663 length:576 start_codon:yes stop_codon:yes gene_type:complete
LYDNGVLRHRARALWLLAKIDGKAEQYVELAAGDEDEEIRAMALRIARQTGLDLVSVASRFKDDESAQVRREALIALRFSGSAEANTLWAHLASKHTGTDRWYLEALGIGADLYWETRFAAWLKHVGDKWNTPGGRDIIWRSRSKQAPALLARILLDEDTPEDQHPRYLRAFDYHNGPEKDAALEEILLGM